MTFGLNEKARMTGAGLYARVFQIASLLPPVYIFLVSGYMALISRKGLFSILFDLGISALPRAEVLALSWVYRLTSSEVIVHFALLILGFVFGLVVTRLLKKEKAARGTRRVLAVLIAADLVLRLIPLRFNLAFGPAAAIAGFVIRLGCLALLLLDMRAARGNTGGNAV
jgi:uncharacterized membrane protein YqaE (UPF0057 family)